MPKLMILVLKTKCAKLRFKHKFDVIRLHEINRKQKTAVQNHLLFRRWQSKSTK